MMLGIQLDPRSQAALKRCQQALGVYSQLSDRVPAKFAGAAVSKLLLGEDDDGGSHTAGLFERLRATAPAPGSIRAAAEDRLRGGKGGIGRPDSTSLSLARARANGMLDLGESAAFKEVSAKNRGTTLTMGALYTRGKRKGEINYRARRSRLKTVVDAIGVSRSSARASGGALLNRQALIAALTISYRERARLATAVQFLPASYRTTIKRLAGVAYRSGQAVGLPGGSADSSRFHMHERALVQNRKGTRLGSLDVDVTAGDAIARLIGEYGLHTGAQQSALADALNVVSDHAIRRSLERVRENSATFHSLMQMKGARP